MGPRGLHSSGLSRAPPSQAKRVICAPAPQVDSFAEFALADDTQLFKEFNSLSVIYNQPVGDGMGSVGTFNSPSPSSLLSERQLHFPVPAL